MALALGRLGQVPCRPAMSIRPRRSTAPHSGRQLEKRGVVFKDAPHLIAAMPDHDLWMAFFDDPDGNALALMREAPKSYQPPRG